MCACAGTGRRGAATTLLCVRGTTDHHQGHDAAFVHALLDDALTQGRRIVSIAGLQGTGKSTLAAQLVSAARSRGLAAEALSIDDFYLTRRERQALGRSVHPLLATRGPPGTHDVALACATVDALLGMQAGGQVRIPVFDKIADRRLPPSRWRSVRTPPALLVFEGWFLRVPPQPAAALATPLNRLEAEEDADGCWRSHVNQALSRYAPLWQRLPWLLFLQGPGFEVVPQWRWQQEQTLQRAHPRRRAMDRAQVDRFVLFFERVSRHALATLPAIADRVVALDAQRRPVA